ncbi:thioredoxin family protein [Paenibacillus sp. N3.4]|uniref:thioredoxin family protein n=1 Tax=Paenibacillus sp. N3.4 TaxID=2603222 RepID=UPI0037C72F29
MVDFGAPWCPPCKTLLPILEELDREYEGEISILKVNVDESQQTARLYSVMSMPTVIFFTNGEALDKLVGLQSKDVYANKITGYLSNMK